MPTTVDGHAPTRGQAMGNRTRLLVWAVAAAMLSPSVPEWSCACNGGNACCGMSGGEGPACCASQRSTKKCCCCARRTLNAGHSCCCSREPTNEGCACGRTCRCGERGPHSPALPSESKPIERELDVAAPVASHATSFQLFGHSDLNCQSCPAVTHSALECCVALCRFVL